MNATTRPLAVLALVLAALLGACGPNNTLSLHSGDGGTRLGAVETGLRKVQGEIRELERKQARTEAHVAALQKKLGVSPGQAARPAPPVPRASALGEGFIRPAAESGPVPPAETASATSAGPEATTPAPTTPQAPAMASMSPPAMSAPVPPPVVPPKAAPTARPAIARPAGPSAPVKRPRGAKGWIGPPAGAPATPEAAIAADRAAKPAPEAPQTATLPLPPAPKNTAAPGAPTAAAPAPATPPATPAAPPVPGPPATPTVPAPAGTAQTSAPAPKDKTPEAPVPGKAQSASPAEKAEYNKALQLAINGHQTESKAAFETFLAAHPQSPLTPNAMYWLGEGAYQRGEYKAAIGEFEKVAKGWPGHHKAADSLYKIAQVQEKSGDIAAARATLERYLRDYPNAELAGAVRQKLQALPK